MPCAHIASTGHKSVYLPEGYATPRVHTMRIFATILLLLTAVFCRALAQNVEWASSVIECSVSFGTGDYGPKQVLDKPNVLPATYFARCAWLMAERGADGKPRKPKGSQHITVGFDDAMQVAQVAVGESFAPGTIEKITLLDTNNDAHVVFQAVPRKISAPSRMFNVTFARTTYAVKAVRLDLRPDLVEGLNQIDAIGISDSSEPLKATINLASRMAWPNKPEHLGPAVNSIYSDFLPVISPDGKTLYFCRTNDPRNIGGATESGNADIWYSTLLENGAWSPARNIGKPLNNDATNAIFSVTPDGNTVLVKGRYNSDGTFAGKGVSMARRTAAGWSVPEALNIDKYYNMNEYSEAYLWNDGTTLLLALEREDSYGDKDLYISFRGYGGTWSAPKNLGPVVNSPGNESSPFLASDGQTLYFASDGFSGYGDKDLFVTHRIDTSWDHFSEPENLGKIVNNTGNNSYFSIAAAGDHAYYSSEDPADGTMDIYRVDLPAEVKPAPVVLVSGTVLGGTSDKPVEATIRYEFLPSGNRAGIASSSPIDGRYKIVLPAGSQFGFRAEAKGFYPISENLNTEGLDRYTELHRDLHLERVEVGQTIRLNNIFFQFGEAGLRPESYPELDRVVEFLQSNPETVIEVSGHTDNIGGDGSNIALSLLRAESVAEYVIGHGIEKERVSARGYGKTRPMASNETDEGRRLNRRVEFTIVK